MEWPVAHRAVGPGERNDPAIAASAVGSEKMPAIERRLRGVAPFFVCDSMHENQETE